jgi:nuclear cap-binding protein subunit 2
LSQNKKRKFDRDRDRDERDGGDRQHEEDPTDPLKDATTLYVGNLYVVLVSLSASSTEALSRSFYTTEEQIHELFAK